MNLYLNYLKKKLIFVIRSEIVKLASFQEIEIQIPSISNFLSQIPFITSFQSDLHKKKSI